MFLFQRLWNPSPIPPSSILDSLEKDFSDIQCSQDYSWDCGVSVIIMVMRWSRRERCLSLNSFYQRETPLWTIDIFDVLMESKVFRGLEFYTCSTDLSYHRQVEFYQNSILEDEVRVRALFQKALDLDWNLTKVSSNSTSSPLIYSRPHSPPLSWLIDSLTETL